jgi:hypothetical protein
MPYEGLGLRHTAIATKDCVHGQIVEEDGFVGAAFKTEQIGRFVDTTVSGYVPAIDADADEEFEIQLGGIHEADRDGNLAAAAVGNHVYIDADDNTLGLAAQGLTGAVLNAGWLPVGIVTDIDTVTDKVLINANVAHLVRGTQP